MIALPVLAGLKAFGALVVGRVTGSRTTAIATLCLAAVVTYGGWLKFVHDPKVARLAEQKIERKTDAQVSKSIAAQRALPVDGAHRRLQSKYCADC